MKSKYTIEQIEVATKNAKSIRQFLLNLGLAGRGGNYSIWKKKLVTLGIDISHFRGTNWRKGKTFKTERSKLDKVLVKNSCYSSGAPYQSGKIKALLFNGDVKYKVCEICGIEEWQNQVIIFELHHVDGDATNNEIQNLQILCPNCHSQTKNFRGKNINK